MSNRRIVMLGKTGVGKSSVCDIIFGEKLFEVGHTVNSETSECRAETKPVNGRNITLIDTPGFFDTDRPEEELKSEIVKCVTECAPGLHAFLIVLKVEKFTEQEQAVITKINQYFSEEAFKYATVLFTHGDQLKEGQTIEDFVRNNKLVSDLLKKCGGRCHVIDNKYWKNNQQDEYRSNQVQVKELLNTIEKMIEANKGSCYTNEMLQAVEEMIKQEEKHIRKSSGNMPEEEIREKAKDRVFERFLIKLAGIARRTVLGALFGLVVPVIVVVSVLMVEHALVKIAAASGTAAAAETGVAAAAETGVAAAAETGVAAAAAGTGVAAAAETGVAAAAAGTAAAVETDVAAAAAGTAAAVETDVAAVEAAEKVAAAGVAAKSAIAVTATCAVVGAVGGGVAGYCEAEKAETPLEAMEKAAKAVINGSKSIVDVTKSCLSK